LKQFLFQSFRRTVAFISGRGLSLSKIPIVEALYERVYWALRPHGVVLLSVHGSKMYYDTNLKGPLYSLVTMGTYERYETEVFQSMLRLGMTVVDIGANVGYYALLAARGVGAEGRVFAFEPDPRTYELMSKSVEANGYRNILVFRKALADRTGTLWLYADALNAGNSTLARENVQSLLDTYEVEIQPLDAFLEENAGGHKVDLIKMDVQGAEGLVLKGATRLLREGGSLKIMMEFEPEKLAAMGTNPSGLLQELVGYGFRIHLIDADARSCRALSLAEIEDLSRLQGYANLLLERD